MANNTITKPHRLKIVGSYAGYGTKVIDIDTGEEIHNVRQITWVHEAGKIPTCTLELVNVTCEAEADVTSPMENGFVKHAH